MLKKEQRQGIIFQEKEIHGSVQEFLDFVAFLEKKYPDSQWLRPQTYTWITEESFQSKAVTFLVEEAGQTIAALIGNPYVDEPSHFKANFMFVDPDFQGRRIASALLEKAKRKYDAITLHASSTGINRSQKRGASLDGFYAKHGFRSYDEEGHRMEWYKK